MYLPKTVSQLLKWIISALARSQEPSIIYELASNWTCIYHTNLPLITLPLLNIVKFWVTCCLPQLSKSSVKIQQLKNTSLWKTCQRLRWGTVQVFIKKKKKPTVHGANPVLGWCFCRLKSQVNHLQALLLWGRGEGRVGTSLLSVSDKRILKLMHLLLMYNSLNSRWLKKTPTTYISLSCVKIPSFLIKVFFSWV